MKIGTCLEFPDGFSGFSNTQQLHLLDNASGTGSTTLVEFVDGALKRADLHRMRRADFEQGLLNGDISIVKQQPTLPPWLSGLEGVDIHSLEDARKNAKRSNIDIAMARLCTIRPLLDQATDVFSAPDPGWKIAHWVREQASDQHPTRVRLWFASYLVFGNQLIALYPCSWRIGKFDRNGFPSSTKFGRPSRQGRKSGCRVDKEMSQKIAINYVRFADLGVTQREIYVRMLSTAFNCTVVGKGEKRRVISKSSEPYPTINQVRYWARKTYAPELLRETIYGATRIRHKESPDVGRFSEGVSNLLEVAEADGYYSPVKLLDFDGQPTDERFCVVRLVDVLTGMIVGIGFAVGAEVASAYRMALFCTAISKQKFCRLFGLEIDDTEWPCQGCPAKIVVDRGPGQIVDMVEDSSLIPFHEMTESYGPRGKATVESKHPRTMQQEGAPSFFQSNFNHVEAARVELLRTISQNWTSDVSARLSPNMICDRVAPNPTSIWNWMDRRGRTSARQISFDQAVRNFLTPVDFKVTRNSVKLYARRFDSSELRQSKLRASIAKGQTVSITGYAMNLCVRYGWIEVCHRIVEVMALLPIRDDDEQLFASLDYLKQEQQNLNALIGAQRELSIAATMEFDEACVGATGKHPSSGHWVSGKAKRSKLRQAAGRAAKAATMP
jgi:hypothetical protein